MSRHLIKTPIILILFISISTTFGMTFLEWGDKCTIPKLGGDNNRMTEECNASKGLYCNGEACVCTYSQRYSIDHVSKECRRKVGKPCQHIDTTLMGHYAIDKLPFNLKCHENAACVQLPVPARAGGVVDIEKVSMCICRQGMIATPNFDACIVPPPVLIMSHIPPPRRPFLKNKYEYSDSDE